MKENPLAKNMAKISVINIYITIPKEEGTFKALMLAADLLLISQLE